MVLPLQDNFFFDSPSKYLKPNGHSSVACLDMPPASSNLANHNIFQKNVKILEILRELDHLC